MKTSKKATKKIPTPKKGARYAEKAPRTRVTGAPRIVEVVELDGDRARCENMKPQNGSGKRTWISFRSLATRFVLVGGAS